MMRYAKAIRLFVLILFFYEKAAAYDIDDASRRECPMTIVIPSYNNEKWYAKNLQSVLHQNYKNYRVIYVNDGSSDDTCTLVEDYLNTQKIEYRKVDFDPQNDESIESIVKSFSALVNREKHFFTLVNNKKRAGALANLYPMIHSCRNNDIIVTVDGDDWLAHADVLNVLNDTYQSGEVWYTHGTLKEYPFGHVAWSEPIPLQIIQKTAYRNFKCPSHLRTFYAWLFKRINLEDFLYHGEFFTMAWDMAIMYPIAEMAAEHHAFIERVLYIYNMSNPINDNRVNAQLQNDMDALIRNKKRYARLLHRDTRDS